jgi:hypothetical protein
MNWLRLHVDFLDNPKIQTLPDNLVKFLVNLWCLARIHGGTLPNDKVVAFRLRCTETEVKRYTETLLETGLLDKQPDGSVIPHDWSEHQYSSDSSSDRVRKFREKKRLGSESSSETTEKRFSNVIEQKQKQIQNRTDTEENCVRGSLPSLRKPTASDMGEPASLKFEQWWETWSLVRGTAYKDQACWQYMSVVPARLEAEALMCAASYVNGPGRDSTRGFRPDNFLEKMRTDGFSARWPSANGNSNHGKESPMEQAKREAREAREKRNNGTR